MGKVEARQAKLRESLIDIAERRIATDGLAALRARDIAADAGCALGSIYTVFNDLEALVLQVNLRSFRTLGQEVADVTLAAQESGDSPIDTLIAMANAYLDFAVGNHNLWRALFENSMSADTNVPDWYLSVLDQLLENIRLPLRVLYPEDSPDKLEMVTRGLFSSIHGIVWLGLERRLSAVSPDHIRKTISIILKRLV